MAISSQYQRQPPVLSRRHVEDLIAKGKCIIIVDDEVLNCDPWMPYHPGGDKALRHMVGRDATDEVNALHSPEARKRMTSYRIGRVVGPWTNFLPPIQGGIFRLLHADCEDERDGNDTAVQYLTIPTTVRQRLVRRSSDASTDSSIGTPASDVSSPASDALATSPSAPPSPASSISPNKPTVDPRLSILDASTYREIQLDLDKYPALDMATQLEIIRKYRSLGQRVKAKNLYQCTYWDYAVESARFMSVFAISIYLLHIGWYKCSALALGLFWHQLVFLAHDSGHMGITHNFHIDTMIGILAADFMGGLSLGWWKKNHNVHHIVTNSPEHDPDIQHVPFFAVSHRFLLSLRSTYYNHIMKYDALAKLTIRIQHRLYYLILAFGRFNLYRLSWTHLLLRQGPRKGPSWWHYWVEVAGQFFFWFWFGYAILYKHLPTNADRLAYFLISHFVCSPVHVQITLSHFCMSTADLGVTESFPQKMLRTTMDVDCPPWLDFIHGGLQFQAIHHLFPRIPRHNLRRAQALVQEYCRDVGIPYAIYGFVDGNAQVLSRLQQVAQQAAILAKCQESMADTYDLGLY